MTETPPPVEYQKSFLEAQIAAHRREHWNASTTAKAYAKAGLKEQAKAQADLAAGIERAVDSFEAELKSLAKK